MIPGLRAEAASTAALIDVGEVAQLVEHTTENRSVDSSILSLATIFSNILDGFEKRQSRSRSRLTNG